MQLLKAPALTYELVGQPVEQFRVCRGRTQLSEVRRRLHQALAEVMHPDAVHEDSRNQRMLSGGQPTGELQPATCAGQTVVIQFEQATFAVRRSKRQRRGSHRLFGLLVIAAVEQFCFRSMIGRLHQSTQEFLDGLIRPHCIDVAVELLQFLARFRDVLIQVSGVDVHAGVLRQNLLLLFRTFVAGCLVRLAKLSLQRLVVLFELLIECLCEIVVLLLRTFRTDLSGFCFDFGGFLSIRLRVQRHSA